MAKFDTYDPNKEAWENYLERLELWFRANKIDTKEHSIHLLTLIGKDTYGVLKNLTAPAKPSDKTYAEITATLQEHFSPATLTLAERFKFGMRNQKEDESVSDFATALRALSAKCEFDTFLDDALCLRLVCGLRERALQMKLIMLKEATFKDVLETAIKYESAEADTQLMNQASLTSVYLADVSQQTSFLIYDLCNEA